MSSSPAFKSVALIGRYNTPASAGTLVQLGEFLVARGCRVRMEQDTARSCGVSGYALASYDAIGADCDLAVVLGGDGSMLSAARHLAAYSVPLVGINHGRLGFMTDIAADTMLETLGKIGRAHV